MDPSPRTKTNWMACASFHGHECPGLAIGFRAAMEAWEALGRRRAEDEELVAVVENDACGVDAVQFLLGCTFGKGNLVYRDHGKQVFTFFDRESRQSLRLSLVPGATSLDPRYRELMNRSRAGALAPEEEPDWKKVRGEAVDGILLRPIGQLFRMSSPRIDLPPKATVQPSELCAACGEPTMPAKMIAVEGRLLCRPCAENAGQR